MKLMNFFISIQFLAKKCKKTQKENKMSKKTFNLVVGITGGCAAIASAVVTYAQPEFAVQIVAAIGIVSTTVSEVCSLFVKTE